MGTTTFYLRHNDGASRLDSLSKEDLTKLDLLSPFGNDNHHGGWHVPMELHNGNVHVLVFWKGRLMKLEDAPQNLNRKYYDKYRGKIRREYEWTILRGYILREVAYLDKTFRKYNRKPGTR